MRVSRCVALSGLFLGFFCASLLGIFALLPFGAWYHKEGACQETKFVHTMLLKEQKGLWARGGFLAHGVTPDWQECYRTHRDYRALQEAGWEGVRDYIESQPAYISHPRLGSVLLYPFWRASQILAAESKERLYIGVWTLRVLTALSTAVALWLLCLWIVREVGLFSGLFVGLGMMLLPLAPTLLYFMGRNPIHKPFFLFLPFLLVAFLMQSAWRKRASVSSTTVAVSFLGGVAALVSFFFGEGYDLLAPMMVSVTIPLFWYAIREQWSLRRFCIGFACLSLAVVLGVGVAVVLHGIQVSAIGIDFIAYAKQRALYRSHGFDQTGSALLCNAPEIVSTLSPKLQASCKSYVFVFVDSLLYQLPFLLLCCLCFCRRSVRCDARELLRHPRFAPLLRAALVCTGLGALAATGQIVMWKQATYFHNSLKVINWLFMFRPFALLSLSLLLEPALLRWSARATALWQKRLDDS